MSTFNGMEIGTASPWQENFTEEYNDDGQLTLLSKEIYHHEEPESELVFDYRYVITATDLRRASGEGDAVYVQLYLAPEPKDWHESSLRKAAVTYGWERASRKTLLKHLRPQDAIENGYAVLIGSDKVQYDPDVHDEGFYDVLDNEDVVKMISTAASAVRFYDSTKGFALDRFQNRIGTTGWDTLDECLNGRDKIRAGLNRMREQKGE